MKKLEIVLSVCMITTMSLSVVKADTYDLQVTYRDFHAYNWNYYSGHPDFENYLGSDPGIVQTTLGMDGKPVYAGIFGNPSTHGQTAFGQWYRDVDGINSTMSGTLTFTKNTDGNYEYLNNSFFPLDEQLFGNEGNQHNYHFTMELHSTFTYKPGQTFSFTGDDDIFVFIDNKLVIDLGGVHQGEDAAINLDTLDLIENNVYNFDLFFAERHTTESNFMAVTNIELNPVPVPGALLLCLLGLGATILKYQRYLF